MGKLHWALLILCLTVAAGCGGWRGPDLWSGWGVWCLLLLPVAWGALTALRWWRSGGPLQVAVVMSGFGIAGLGAAVLGIAWAVAEGTGRWSSEPAVRAIFGVGLGAAGGGLAWLYATSRKTSDWRETSGSKSTGGLAEPGSAPDRGGLE
jgi:hypothetical protein